MNDNNLKSITPQNNNLNNNTPDNIVSITPINVQDNKSVSVNNSSISNMTVDSSIQMTNNNDTNNELSNNVNSNLSVVMPAMKEDSNDSNNLIQNNNNGLILDNNNPFDIGVNNNINNSLNQNNFNQNSGNNLNSNELNAQSNNVINNSLPVDVNSNNELTVGFYIKNILLFSIPIIGLIFLIKKALNKEDKNESVFAKAYLILYAIVFGFFIVLWIIFTIISVAFINSKTDNINYTTTIQEDYNG